MTKAERKLHQRRKKKLMSRLIAADSVKFGRKINMLTCNSWEAHRRQIHQSVAIRLQKDFRRKMRRLVAIGNEKEIAKLNAKWGIGIIK